MLLPFQTSSGSEPAFLAQNIRQGRSLKGCFAATDAQPENSLDFAGVRTSDLAEEVLLFFVCLCSATSTNWWVFLCVTAASLEARASKASEPSCVPLGQAARPRLCRQTGNCRRVHIDFPLATAGCLGFVGFWQGRSQSPHHVVWTYFQKSKNKTKSDLARAVSWLCFAGAPLKAAKPLPDV